MQQLWRLYRAKHGPGLDGTGGTFSPGRWHTLGTRVVYFGVTAAIVVLERLAHTDADLLPDDLRLGLFEFDKPVHAEKIGERTPLPGNWMNREATTRKLGTEWVRSRSGCLLEIPSALLPEESNYLLNPQHESAEHLHLIRERGFSFDSRLI